jgi:hypothetical protein
MTLVSSFVLLSLAIEVCWVFRWCSSCTTGMVGVVPKSSSILMQYVQGMILKKTGKLWRYRFSYNMNIAP